MRNRQRVLEDKARRRDEDELERENRCILYLLQLKAVAQHAFPSPIRGPSERSANALHVQLPAPSLDTVKSVYVIEIQLRAADATYSAHKRPVSAPNGVAELYLPT